MRSHTNDEISPTFYSVKQPSIDNISRKKYNVVHEENLNKRWKFIKTKRLISLLSAIIMIVTLSIGTKANGLKKEIDQLAKEYEEKNQ